MNGRESVKILLKEDLITYFPHFNEDICENGIYGRISKLYKGNAKLDMYNEEIHDNNGTYVLEPYNEYHMTLDKTMYDIPTHKVYHIPLEDDLYITHRKTMDEEYDSRPRCKDPNLYSIRCHSRLSLNKSEPILIFVYGERTGRELKQSSRKRKKIKNWRSDYGYQEFREMVINRDNCCKCCGTKENLEVHHIFPYNQYKTLRTDVSNGLTLCKDCHKRYHSLYGKKQYATPQSLAKYIQEYGEKRLR